jgi:hypothetical protein
VASPGAFAQLPAHAFQSQRHRLVVGRTQMAGQLAQMRGIRVAPASEACRRRGIPGACVLIAAISSIS